MNIFKLITGNIVKWWQFKILPILKIDNNPNAHNSVVTTEEHYEEGSPSGNRAIEPETGIKQEVVTGAEPVQPDMTDAASVFERLNREKEEERKKLFEKAQEEARLAAIMNANKVDVSAYIQEGKKAREEELAEKAGRDTNTGTSDSDAMARAEEIIARLNREAAEDEAKKKAEIDAAREKAKETFGG